MTDTVRINTECGLKSGNYIEYYIDGVKLNRVIEFKYETGAQRLRYVTLKMEVSDVIVEAETVSSPTSSFSRQRAGDE